MTSERTYEEHPFAQYVRILGKGKKGSRSLTLEEAECAMGMILDEQVEPEQLGAFLMLLRVKEETGEELAGFVKAVKHRIQAPAGMHADLDWSSYAGKRRHLPWFLLSIFLLAENKHRVFIHGASGHTADRIYTDEVLNDLGFTSATNWQAAKSQLEAQAFTFMPLAHINKKLDSLINLRPIMGLRSPVHSLARLINPLDAKTVLQGIFHPPYSQLHQDAGKLLAYDYLSVIKGEGGEIERNPDNELTARTVTKDGLYDEVWPSLFARRHVKGTDLSASYLSKVWQGKENDEYGQAATTSTLALALKSLGAVKTQDEAIDLANTYWSNRNKTFI
jgi:anthranilate phosphoribosyltransferase